MSLHRGEECASEPLHLRDYWQILRRRRWFACGVFALLAALGAARLLLMRPLYQATAQVLIERPLPSVLGFERDAHTTDVWEDFYQTQCRLLQSRLLARKVVERLKLVGDPEFSGSPSAETSDTAEAGPAATSLGLEQAIDGFLAKLKVEPLKNSQLLVLHFRSQRPGLAARAANALADVYVEQTREFRSRASAEAGAWLNGETREQSRKIEAAEHTLQRYVEDEGLGNIEERRALLEQKLKDLGTSLTLAKTRRLEKEAQYRQMHSAANPEELPGVIASPLIQTLRTELAGLERQSAQLLAKGYLEAYPDVVKVRQQFEGTQQKIALEARSIVRAAVLEYETAMAQEHSIAATLDSATKEALELARRSLKYDALKTDLEAS